MNTSKLILLSSEMKAAFFLLTKILTLRAVREALFRVVVKA